VGKLLERLARDRHFVCRIEPPNAREVGGFSMVDLVYALGEGLVAVDIEFIERDSMNQLFVSFRLTGKGADEHLKTLPGLASHVVIVGEASAPDAHRPSVVQPARKNPPSLGV
jgi:hypothetical protein